MSASLQHWLAELERRHPRTIELGLERVGTVWQALDAPRPARRVLTVGGTNGKGSTVAFVEAAAQAMGWRGGSYTSPHLLRYNERIRIDGAEASDASIVAAFERIEAARGEIALTYFEFGTLAALLLMAQADLDLAVLEVGLGGRLDAVNIIDADVAVITTVALDHQDWLGDSRAGIAREKAGIARAGRPVVLGERAVEPSLPDLLKELGAKVFRLGEDFDHEQVSGGNADPARRWWSGGGLRLELPQRLPLVAPAQWDNAAAALMALYLLMATQPHSGHDSDPRSKAGVDVGAPTLDDAAQLQRAAMGLSRVSLPGRLQRLAQAPEIRVDVGHNPQAAALLADWLAANPGEGVTDAVFSALADKDIAGIVAPLSPWIRHWYLAGLDGANARGLPARELAQRVSGVLPAASIRLHDDVAAALTAARENAGEPDRILVFGSFHTVAEAMRAMDGT